LDVGWSADVPKIAKELSDKAVEKLSRQQHGKSYAVLYAVGGCRGLQLKVPPTGTATWLLRFKLQSGKRVDRSLGSYPAVSLREARQLGNELRRKLWESPRVDPTLERKRVMELARQQDAAAELAAKVTFGQDAEALHATKAQEFKNAKHSAQWISSLRTYAKKIWDKPVSDVSRDDVLAVLEPDWATKTETMTRVRQRIEQVLAYAAVKKHRPDNVDNPARWQGGLQLLLPKPNKLRKVKHHAALPWKQLPAFMAELAKRDGTAAQALRFAILTAARSGEVRLARWREVDPGAALWVVPAERMKANKEHKVPLPASAVALLRELPQGEPDDLIFRGAKGSALSDMALLAVCQRMHVDAVPHGFRSSFKDWAREELGAKFADEVSELQLAHVSDDKTRAAYARGELIELRRELMKEWADFLGSVSTQKGV
jgi:integrase